MVESTGHGCEVRLHYTRIEGRRHDDQLQVRACRFLQHARACQGDVTVDMAFVKLIEQDRRHAVEVRRRQQAAQQDALGHVAYAGGRRGLTFEPYLVAHL